MHTGKSVAEPAQVKDIPRSQPAVFEWYENRVEEGLAKLYRVDVGQRQRIVEIIRELQDSCMFWKLMSNYDDSSEEGRNEDEKNEALMALLARVYIAGTLRGCQAVDL